LVSLAQFGLILVGLKIQKNRKIMKKSILMMILMLMPFFAFSQKGVDFVDGWIVLKKTGDTLRGQVCYKNTISGERYDKVYFIDAANSKKRYGHEKISSVMADKKIYDFIIIDYISTMPFLMERVVTGDIYMYKAWFKTANYTPTKPDYEEAVFLRKKSSDEYVEIFPKNFYKQMKSYFKGDEDIVQLVKENNYEIGDLDKVVIAYNEKE